MSNNQNGESAMIRKILSLYISLYLISFGFVPVRSVFAQGGRTFTIAITNLSAQGVSEVEAAVLSDMLRSHITQFITSQEYQNMEGKDRYEVVEREDMDKIFEQFEIQSTGCVSDSCMIEFGKMLQVDRILMGTLGRIGNSHTLSVRITDIESAKTLATASSQRQGSIEDVMDVIIKEVSNDLFMGRVGKSHKMWYILAGIVVAGAGAGAALMGGGGNGGGGSTPEPLPLPPGRP